MNGHAVWQQPAWRTQALRIIRSFNALLKRPLVEPTDTNDDVCELLFHAPFVVVSHTADHDPLLNYGNATALRLWEMSPEELVGTPSRLTAEPMHRDERSKMLERTTRDGFVDDYRGIRISATGRRFRIDQAIVWNLVDEEGQQCGQAATFSEWTYLDDE